MNVVFAMETTKIWIVPVNVLGMPLKIVSANVMVMPWLMNVAFVTETTKTWTVQVSVLVMLLKIVLVSVTVTQ